MPYELGFTSEKDLSSFSVIRISSASEGESQQAKEKIAVVDFGFCLD